MRDTCRRVFARDAKLIHGELLVAVEGSWWSVHIETFLVGVPGKQVEHDFSLI
jgi:hypothetical protein